MGVLAALATTRPVRVRPVALPRRVDAFMVELSHSLRHRAKRELELRTVKDALTGAVTVIQRGDSALRLNVHFHVLVLDGVYVRACDGGLTFQELRAPTGEQAGLPRSRVA